MLWNKQEPKAPPAPPAAVVPPTPGEMMLKAIDRGDEKGLQAALLGNNVDPDLDGGQPLIHAAGQSNFSFARTLVKAGADVDLAIRTAREAFNKKYPDAKDGEISTPAFFAYDMAGKWLRYNAGALKAQFNAGRFADLKEGDARMTEQLAAMQKTLEKLSAPPKLDKG